ncbi:hypothetical protein [Actinomadura decatromicini]|uniref:hypothetical protein n=1 Tax=Actinomadura decatromicini TaxID=2604572 RepID=UPI0016531EBF|nr:hypothetical protein [Actinomadura decatromicini]
MTALAVAMDVVAAGFLACSAFLLTRGRGVSGGEGGGSTAMLLIAVSLGLLSVSLWSLP